MAKSNIELEQAFYVDGIKYICVGHDNGLIWGATHVNGIEEAKGFDFYKCTVKSEFTIEERLTYLEEKTSNILDIINSIHKNSNGFLEQEML